MVSSFQVVDSDSVTDESKMEEEHGWPELSGNAVYAHDDLLSHFLNSLSIFHHRNLQLLYPLSSDS